MGEIILEIDKLAFGGAGFGHVDGKACFVPFTTPGDRIRARIVREKRSYLEAELLEILVPGLDRVEPPCPVFGSCGGCDWQHIAYDRQLQEKQKIYAEFLWRTARVAPDRILPIAGARDPYGYRSRLQLKLRYIGGELRVGFYRSGSHFVVDIPDRCVIAHPALNALIAGLRRCLEHSPEPDKIPQVDLAVGDDGTATMIIHYIGSHQQEIVAFLERTRGVWPADTGIFLQSGRKATIVRIGGCELLRYRVPASSVPDGPELELSFSPGGFSQVNYQQNRHLVQTVEEWLELTGSERVLDLYCGNGNFSLPLAGSAAEVVGMEIFGSSIADADSNAVSNGFRNVSFYCSDAADAIKRLATAEEKFDIVLLDPPRAGAADIVTHLPALQPRCIVYVSCDPATLARDLATLKKSGYGVVRSSPVDMFPQTYHIESVTLLRPDVA